MPDLKALQQDIDDAERIYARALDAYLHSHHPAAVTAKQLAEAETACILARLEYGDAQRGN